MDKLKMHSLDLTRQNIARIAEFFPNCVTESRSESGSLTQSIDIDLLRQELTNSIVEGPQERYNLNWPGKREALLGANSPIAKTLRPCQGESVQFDTTRNLFIEGDNLDALKLLQETFLNKVRVIYIDPPYNTGNDFIYDDYFADSARDYLTRSSQLDETGNRMVSNAESRGRFHSDWLSMIFSRLKLARNLLSEDGVIFISIDDHESANLKTLCDEVFGSINFIATLVWEKGRKNDARLFSVGHEYILVFAKSIDVLRDKKTIWREEKPGARELWDQYLKLRSQFHSDDKVETALREWFATLPNSHPSRKWSRYKHVDKNGPWRDDNISWPGGGGPRYDVLHPVTKKPCKVPERGWVFASPEEMQRRIAIGVIAFRDDHTEPPLRKSHIRPFDFETTEEELEPLEDSIPSDAGEGEEPLEEELATQVRGSYFYKQSQVSVKYLRKLMGAKVFTNPKDHSELARLIKYVTSETRDGIIIDFFAGSASTAEAVFEANASDEGKRQVILVQLPEKLDPSKKEQKVAFEFCKKLNIPANIAEISKERIRRAGVRLKKELREEGEDNYLDVGFRVLKIDTSNMKDVYYPPDGTIQKDLFAMVDNIKEDRTSEDLLFQILLDWGVDLTLPIARETIDGREVFFVDSNALAACFDKELSEETIKGIACRKPLRAVFRDASFANDSVKINIEQVFKYHSPSTDLKCI